MRSLMLTMITSVALAGTACDDSNPSKDTGGGDTIDDSNQPVDTADSSTSNTTEDTSSPPEDSTATTAPPTDATVEETDTGPAPIIVVINEVSADLDWVELYNAGTTTADIGGYGLIDNNDASVKFIIPQGISIPVGGYQVIGQDPDGLVGFDFGLGDNDGVFLYDRSDALKSNAVWTTDQAPAGATWGRFPDGTGPYKTLYQPTEGAANLDNPPATCGNNVLELGETCDGTAVAEGVDCTDWGWGGGTLGCTACKTYVFTNCTPHAAGLVINEVTSADPDRIELYNGAPVLLALNGYYLMDDAGNTYTFTGGNIAAGAYKVLTKDEAGGFTFGIGSNDFVELYDNNQNLLDRADWLDDEAETSYCRSPNGNGGFKPCTSATFGTANP